VLTKTDRWLYGQPLWLYVAIVYAAGFGLWAAVVYSAAWASGGIHAGEMGFSHGTFSLSSALIVAGEWMTVLVGVRWRQQGQKTVGWLVSLAAVVAGAFLLFVAPA
jgi:hypothetical protein